MQSCFWKLKEHVLCFTDSYFSCVENAQIPDAPVIVLKTQCDVLKLNTIDSGRH